MVLKDFMSAVQSGSEMPEAVTKIVEEDPGEKLRLDQKEVNKRRKALRKIQNLEEQIVEKEARFACWKENMNALLEQEEKRHAENMKKLTEQLKDLKGQDMETTSDAPSSANAMELDAKRL